MCRTRSSFTPRAARVGSRSTSRPSTFASAAEGGSPPAASGQSRFFKRSCTPSRRLRTGFWMQPSRRRLALHLLRRLRTRRSYPMPRSLRVHDRRHPYSVASADTSRPLAPVDAGHWHAVARLALGRGRRRSGLDGGRRNRGRRCLPRCEAAQERAVRLSCSVRTLAMLPHAGRVAYDACIAHREPRNRSDERCSRIFCWCVNVAGRLRHCLACGSTTARRENDLRKLQVDGVFSSSATPAVSFGLLAPRRPPLCLEDRTLCCHMLKSSRTLIPSPCETREDVRRCWVQSSRPRTILSATCSPAACSPPRFAACLPRAKRLARRPLGN